VAADLHIHVMTDDMTEEDLACFFSNTLGSKWGPQMLPDNFDDLDDEAKKTAWRGFNGGTVFENHCEMNGKWWQLSKEEREAEASRWGMSTKFRDENPENLPHFSQCIHWSRIANSPNIWIGEVSWLKAQLFDKPGQFIPEPVGHISDAIDEDMPVIDDDLIELIMEAFTLPNSTGHGDFKVFEVTDRGEKVREFLEEHRGKRCFTVSW
jgi:hypothetical protein